MKGNEYPPREEATREEWESYQQELKNLANTLRSHFGEVYEEIVEFAHELKEKFPDYQEYIGFHVIAGSTALFEDSPKLDFPEPYSVKSFYKRMQKEFGIEPEEESK